MPWNFYYVSFHFEYDVPVHLYAYHNWQCDDGLKRCDFTKSISGSQVICYTWLRKFKV